MCEGGFAQKPLNEAGVNCVDIGECADGDLNTCDVNAECMNMGDIQLHICKNLKLSVLFAPLLVEIIRNSRFEKFQVLL